jgi:anaerobic ribonucleoside-triphosphate reductase
MNIVDEKIHIIAKEIQEAKASQWTITKIIKELSEMDTRSDKKLRKRALELLKKLDKEAAKIYETFSKMKVYTSLENIENFNRGQIIKSLLNETNITRNVAEKITKEVEEQIKDSKINYLTPALIREMVDSKLIGYGLEEIRNQYAKVGEPVFQIQKKLKEKSFSNESTREFVLLRDIPKQIREKHYNGEIFIEDLAGFESHIYSYNFISKREDSLEKTILRNVGKLIKKEKYFSLPPNLFGLTLACGSFVQNDKQAKKAAELIEEALKLPKQGFVNSLELFTPRILEEYSDARLNASKITNNLLKDESVVSVDSKYCLKLIDQKNKNFMILNNFNEEYFPLNNGFFSTEQGMVSFVNINLQKIAQNYNKNFFEKIKEISEEIKELDKIKRKKLEEKNYLKEFNIEKMKTGIGLTNLFDLYKEFEGEKTKEFANKTYKVLSKKFDDFLLFGLGSEKAKAKFSKEYGKEVLSHEAIGFEECLESKKCCFTGKASTLKEVYEMLDKKVKQIKFIGKTE